MKRLWILLTILVLLGTVGCEKKESAGTENVKAMATCPTCGQEMPEDAYCAGCKAVATTETALVHCDVCDKDYKPGTYCAHCNRFMLNARVHCGNCQDKVVKGHYCTIEKLFKGLPEVAYCEVHGKPYAKSQSCPDCQTQTTDTKM
jgi:hypothetical protein